MEAAITITVEFKPSLRFEIFFALMLLTDDRERAYPGWRNAMMETLPVEFHRLTARYHFTSYFWGLMSDMLHAKDTDTSFDELVSILKSIPAKEVTRNILEGTFHYAEVAGSVISREIDLSEAVSLAPRGKRPWLRLLGLYPFKENAPAVKGLTLLLDNPEEFRNTCIEILSLFWNGGFKAFWNSHYSEIERSAKEKRMEYLTSDLDSIVRRLDIPIEINFEKGWMRAYHDNFEFAANLVDRAIIIPTIFNYRRLWTFYDITPKKRNLFLFYLLNLLQETPQPNRWSDSEPEYVCKALGDMTRWTIATLIALEPLPAQELAKRLSLTKATVSHHVSIMRQAGLLIERYHNGSVLLTIRRDVIENLSENLIRILFKK